MTTLIASYNSEGCTGRCDARCHDAASPDCECICGGINHGAGQKKAMENTQRLAEQMMANWKADHPDTKLFSVPISQLPLFGA